MQSRDKESVTIFEYTTVFAISAVMSKLAMTFKTSVGYITMRWNINFISDCVPSGRPWNTRAWYSLLTKSASCVRASYCSAKKFVTLTSLRYRLASRMWSKLFSFMYASTLPSRAGSVTRSDLRR